MRTLRALTYGLLALAASLALTVPTWAQTSAPNPGPSFVAPAPAASATAPQTAGTNLVIGGVPMRETAENYLSTIKYLTVPPGKHDSPAFKSNNVAAVRGLESPLRRQIFEAMLHNHSDRFVFESLGRAQENFTMRVAAVLFMGSMGRGPQAGVDFDYSGGGTPSEADLSHWAGLGSPSFAFGSLPGVRASLAIDGITQRRFRGECLGALQITVLQAARRAVGPQRFDALHPAGLKVGVSGGGAERHVRAAARVAVADMVPGDWVYMKNKDDYNSDLRPGTTPGPWSGENAVYMGRYDVDSDGPQYHGGAAPRFSGMGVYDVTDTGMRHAIKQGYLNLMRPPHTFGLHTITDADIRWVQVTRLVTGD
jgi:hypothetical protein